MRILGVGKVGLVCSHLSLASDVGQAPLTSYIPAARRVAVSGPILCPY